MPASGWAAAALAAQLIDEIDRLALKINPAALGGGVPLFGSSGYATRRWTRTSTQAFTSGVIFAEYARG
ncbi:hypothetical protein [Microbacterium lacticum]